VREGGGFIGAWGRGNRNEIKRIKIGKITASSGEFPGRRLTTTSVLTCGSRLSAKKRKERGSGSGKRGKWPWAGSGLGPKCCPAAFSAIFLFLFLFFSVFALNFA
jgi:hypothetical protein